MTDVDLFEEFPTNYEVAARRRQRWVRGDWQLLPWILGRSRDASGRKPRTRISAHDRWKMLDNLRRSLSPPSLFLLGLAAWILPGVSPFQWTGLLLASIVIPSSMPVLDGLIPRGSGISKRSHLRAIGRDIQVAALQILLAITVLAYWALYMTDAILRTLGRLYITKRNLLEWVAAAQVGYGADLRLRAFCLHLSWSVLLASGAGVLFVIFKPEAWPVAGPLVLLETEKMGPGARPHLAAERSPEARRETPPLAERDTFVASHRKADLALLRGIRERRGALPAAG